eukprot:345289-Chlamydomonas_euryale.AAC.3
MAGGWQPLSAHAAAAGVGAPAIAASKRACTSRTRAHTSAGDGRTAGSRVSTHSTSSTRSCCPPSVAASSGVSVSRGPEPNATRWVTVA